MGDIVHNALVVSGSHGEYVDLAWGEAIGIFGASMVSDILRSPVNGVRTFFVGPDGSKEGWEESNAGDHERDRFVAYLIRMEYEDGSSPLDWVEIRYGYEEAEIVRDSGI